MGAQLTCNALCRQRNGTASGGVVSGLSVLLSPCARVEPMGRADRVARVGSFCDGADASVGK